MGDQYGKAARKKLRQLAMIAYERELDQEMEKLSRQFDKWRSKKIDCFELSDLIHAFHQGASRDIWKTYNYLDPDMAVSRAVAKGILKKDEIPEERLKYILTRKYLFEQD